MALFYFNVLCVVSISCITVTDKRHIANIAINANCTVYEHLKISIMEFKIGDKVKVCNDLETTIEKVEFSEKYGFNIYWFKDETGKLWNEAEYAIELLP